MQHSREFNLPAILKRKRGRPRRVAFVLVLVFAALVACGPSEGGVEDVHAIGQSATAPVQLVIRLPNAMAPQDAALAASDWLRLNDRAQVRAGSQGRAPVVNTGSGTTELGVEAGTGDVWSQGAVSLRDRARVEGSIRSASTVSRAAGTVVSGTVTPSTPITPLRESSWEVSLPPQTGGDVNLEPDRQRQLVPGGYGHATVKSRSTLKLTSGTYLFQSMMLEPQSHLLVDDTAGPVVLYVNSSFTFRGSVDQARAPAAPAPELLVVVLGDSAVPVEAPFVGTIFAPNALLRLASATHTGGFIGRQVDVGAGAQVVHRALQWSLVLPPGEISMTDAPVILRASRQHDVGQAQDGAVNPPQPVTFQIPAFVPVTVGNAANGLAEFSFRSTNQSLVICVYRGASTVAHPVDDLDRARGTRYGFVSCNNGLQPDAATQGTEFKLRVLSGDTNHVTQRTSIELHLGEGCSGPLPPPILPDQVVELRESFSWRTMPRLPDLDPTGRPALFYGLIYIESKEQAADLDRLNILWSALPLFRSHIREYAGKCGKTSHAADSRGMFVYAIFPSRIFNMYRGAGIRSELEGIAPPLRAIIPSRADEPGAFNVDDSLSYAALARTMYPAWLAERRSQQPLSFPSWDDVTDWVDENIVDPVVDVGSDIIGYVGGSWDGFLDFVVIGTDDIWEGIQQGLQEFAFIFADKVHVRLDVTVLNRDPAFGSASFRPGLVRGWGSGAGSKLLPFGAQVRVRQWWGILPTMDQEALGPTGRVELEALKDASAREGAICIELDTDDGMMTSDFIPDEVCGFSNLKLDGFAHDTQNKLMTDHAHLHALAQIVDSAQYSSQVMRRDPHKVDVLIGKTANELTSAINPQGGLRAMTACLDFPGLGQAGLATILGGVTQIAGAAKSNHLGTELVFYSTGLILKDIFWPGDPASNDSRGVMTHEYGHFSMCSLLFDDDGPSGLNGLLLRLGEPGETRDEQIAVMTEALADAFAIQVVGGTNYFGVNGSSTTFNNNDMRYCTASPCLDRNFRGTGEADPRPFNDEVGRQTSLMHDAFDLHTGLFRLTNNPWNGDVWAQGSGGPLQLSSAAYITIPDEFVNLPGSAWSTWINRWIERGRTPDYHNVLGGLSDAMAAHGYDWCRRCEVFAIHNASLPRNGDDLLVTHADRFARWTDCVTAPGLIGILGPPPDPDLNMNSACQACPAGAFSDSGTCTQCPEGQVPRGDHCEVCASESSCTRCPPGEGLQGGVCAPCPAGQGTNPQNQCAPCASDEVLQAGVCVMCASGERPDPTTNTCRPCPPDAVLDWATVPQVCNVNALVQASSSIASPDLCPDEYWIEVQNVDQIVGPLEIRVRPLTLPTEAQCPSTLALLNAYSLNASGGWELFGSIEDAGRWVTPSCRFEDVMQLTPASLSGQTTLRFTTSGRSGSTAIATGVGFEDRGHPICDPG